MVKLNRFGNQDRLRFQLTTIQFGLGCIELVPAFTRVVEFQRF
jgi:hypothetical protein